MAERQGKEGIRVCKISKNSSWHRRKKKERSIKSLQSVQNLRRYRDQLHIAPCGLALYRLKRQIIFIAPPTAQPCN